MAGGARNPQMHHVHSRSCVGLCVCVRFVIFHSFFFSRENFSVKLIFQSVTLTSDAMKRSKQKNKEKRAT